MRLAWLVLALSLLHVARGSGQLSELAALRAPTQLLRSHCGVLRPEATADVRSGWPAPPSLPFTAAQLVPTFRFSPSEHDSSAGGGRRVRSACQHLPAAIEPHNASVASANARGGPAVPAGSQALNERRVHPVLEFPEAGLDDTAAYQGYQTRFYHDSKNNAVQIYLQPKTSRAVLVWADAANESVGLTARDRAGRGVKLGWGATEAEVADSGPARNIQFQLTAPVSHLELGWFVLGSMRVERDFVYAERHLKPFASGGFRVAEESLLVAAVERLPGEERARHLTLLNASSIAELRSRLEPALSLSKTDSGSVARISRPSLDGRNRLILELRVDPRRTRMAVTNQTVSIRTRPGSNVGFSLTASTDAAPLRTLSREKIFNRAFLDFLRDASSQREGSEVVRYRRLERQVRGVELLSSEEKLMAGLPNFATYFGRDMMMTALMMRPIWVPEMSEHVIASVLRKLGPHGEVSHEEALGGQAIREHAVVYDSLVKAYLETGGSESRADSLLQRAGDVLRNLQQTRENYHMVDDELQLPVLAARYLADTAIPATQKRAFLLQKADQSASHLALLLQELALVASLTTNYVRDQRATNLVSFPRLDSLRWRSASWRDSDAGYARGRFAMDINTIWAPAALESMATILKVLPQLGFPAPSLDTIAPAIRGSDLATYIAKPAALSQAISAWKGARRHFTLTLSPADIRQGLRAKLHWLPRDEQRYWNRALSRHGETRESLSFLALSLDSAGHPIPVVNTDPATELFLNQDPEAAMVRQDIEPFLRPYPVGLFVEGLGPVVVNDAYATREVWDRFKADHYHGPRVVWGREVNLLLLGLAARVSDPSTPGLDGALRRTLEAVNASGLQHNELWSYEIKGGKLQPVRYGTSSDVQLWNTTNLVVQYVLSRLPQ